MARRLAPGGPVLAGAVASIGSASAASHDFTPLTTPSGFLQAGGLNNSGQLVGTFFDDPAGTSELATPAAIAEPATLGLFAVAAALLGSLRRRRPGLTRSA